MSICMWKTQQCHPPKKKRGPVLCRSRFPSTGEFVIFSTLSFFETSKSRFKSTDPGSLNRPFEKPKFPKSSLPTLKSIFHSPWRFPVPESISLLHSYLWMWPLIIVSPTILAPLTKSAGFPGAQGTRERAAWTSTLQNAFFALLSCWRSTKSGSLHV